MYMPIPPPSIDNMKNERSGILHNLFLALYLSKDTNTNPNMFKINNAIIIKFCINTSMSQCVKTPNIKMTWIRSPFLYYSALHIMLYINFYTLNTVLLYF